MISVFALTFLAVLSRKRDLPRQIWRPIDAFLSLGLSGLRRYCLTNKAVTTLVFAMLLMPLSGSTVQEKSSKTAPFRVKGSFVIAAICRDGIIIASDSRGMLKDHQGRRIAYYDTNQKIFPIGNKVIADTGYASLNDPRISFLSALMFRFAESPLSRVEVDQLPTSYFKYVGGLLPAAGAESAKIQTLVFAGYKQHKPLLCIYQGESGHNMKCRSSGYLSSPKQQISGLENVSTLSFEDAGRVMRQTIKDYASAVQPGFVGGPVVLRTMTRAGSRWFGEHPDWPNWGSFTDLAEDYKHDRVPFRLMPGITKMQLDALIDDGATWARVGQSANPDKNSGSAPVIGSFRPKQ